MPGGETREIIDDPRRVRPEIVRTVGVDQDACRIDAVMGVAAKVGAAVYDRAFPSGRSQALGDHEAGEAGADDQEVGGGVSLQGAGNCGFYPATLPPLVDRSGRKRNLGGE